MPGTKDLKPEMFFQKPLVVNMNKGLYYAVLKDDLLKALQDDSYIFSTSLQDMCPMLNVLKTNNISFKNYSRNDNPKMFHFMNIADAEFMSKAMSSEKFQITTQDHRYSFSHSEYFELLEIIKADIICPLSYLNFDAESVSKKKSEKITNFNLESHKKFDEQNFDFSPLKMANLICDTNLNGNIDLDKANSKIIELKNFDGYLLNCHMKPDENEINNTNLLGGENSIIALTKKIRASKGEKVKIGTFAQMNMKQTLQAINSGLDFVGTRYMSEQAQKGVCFNFNAQMAQDLLETDSTHNSKQSKIDASSIFETIDVTKKLERPFGEKIDSACKCYCCEKFTLDYLHHLFNCKELTGISLVSIHNLHMFNNYLCYLKLLKKDSLLQKLVDIIG